MANSSNQIISNASDADKIVIYQYIVEKKELPPWSRGDDHFLALRALTGWSEERLQDAIETSIARGHITTEIPD